MATGRKIVLFGARQVGKTSLVETHSGGTFSSDYIEASKRSTRVFVPAAIFTTVIDSIGYDDISNVSKETIEEFKKADGGLLVFSLDNQKSFEEVRDALVIMKKHIKGPIVLVGNKVDLERAVTYKLASDIAESHNISYVETSASKQQNIHLPFEKLAEEIGQFKLKDTVATISAKFANVGPSRIKMRDDLIATCKSATSVNVMVDALKDISAKAQEDHINRSGTKLFYLFGPVIKQKSTTAKIADELVAEYEAKRL